MRTDSTMRKCSQPLGQRSDCIRQDLSELRNNGCLPPHFPATGAAAAAASGAGGELMTKSPSSRANTGCAFATV